MKYILYIVMGLFAGSVFTGCEQQEIALYNQPEMLNFKGLYNIYELTDSHYVKKTPMVTDSFMVILQGEHLQQSRDFCLKQMPAEEHGVQLVLAEKYTFTDIKNVDQTYRYIIKVPELVPGVKEHKCTLTFDYENPMHQFRKGVVERSQVSVVVRWNIKPESWDEWSDYGKYSDAKYKFMMDVCKCTYDELPEDAMDKIKAAYEEFVAKNSGFLKDENGEDVKFENED